MLSAFGVEHPDEISKELNTKKNRRRAAIAGTGAAVGGGAYSLGHSVNSSLHVLGARTLSGGGPQAKASRAKKMALAAVSRKKAKIGLGVSVAGAVSNTAVALASNKKRKITSD